MLTIVVFLAVLSILVLVHEFGHFVVGRLLGTGIVEFALGLPFTKPLWSKKLRSGMRLSFYPLLFGGFVRLLGEEGDGRKSSEEEGGIKGEYFYKANVWARMATVAAGVLMNFLLAIGLFYLFLGFSSWRVLVPKLADYNFISPHEENVVVTFVQKDTPAEKAGLSVGNVLVSVDGKRFSKLADFQSYTRSKAGFPIDILVLDESLSFTREVIIVPRISPPAGQGPLGVGIGEGIAVRYQSTGEKILSGLGYGVDMLFYNVRLLVHLVFTSFRTGSAAPLAENVSGPVGIAGAVGTILGLGGREAILSLLNFVGLLSLSLAFMNILPIPALDGGRLAFLLVEAFAGKKMAAKKENLVNQVGLVVLLALIILISFNDLKKVLTR